MADARVMREMYSAEDWRAVQATTDLCEVCGDNLATQTINGDPMCNRCAQWWRSQ